MRITGGNAKGITLKTPRGRQTRPASDAMRESLFSSLGNRVVGCRVADLFAGTGSYGLEAFSRGASSGRFVEMNGGCVRCIEENIARVAKSMDTYTGSFSSVRADVFKWKRFEPGEFDIVFADPPYGDIPSIEAGLFELAEQLLGEDGLLVLEKPSDINLTPVGWELIKQLGKKRGRGPSLDLWKKNQSAS
jgi:16S rRNA (guanine966-N2)-methyltransferase